MREGGRGEFAAANDATLKHYTVSGVKISPTPPAAPLPQACFCSLCRQPIIMAMMASCSSTVDNNNNNFTKTRYTGQRHKKCHSQSP